jgi:hypothetical protein
VLEDDEALSIFANDIKVRYPDLISNPEKVTLSGSNTTADLCPELAYGLKFIDLPSTQEEDNHSTQEEDNV